MERGSWRIRLCKIPKDLEIIVGVEYDLKEFRVEFEKKKDPKPVQAEQGECVCFYCGVRGHKANACQLKSDGKSLRERRGFLDLGLKVGPSSPIEGLLASSSFCPDCGVEGAQKGHECSKVAAVLASFMQEFGDRGSGNTEKLESSQSTLEE